MRTAGFYGSVGKTDSPITLVSAALADRDEQIRAKDAALLALRRMLGGGLGALPFTREAAVALCDAGLGASEDDARESLNSLVAGINSGEEG